jgi:hypothetical protein
MLPHERKASDAQMLAEFLSSGLHNERGLGNAEGNTERGRRQHCLPWSRPVDALLVTLVTTGGRPPGDPERAFVFFHCFSLPPVPSFSLYSTFVFFSLCTHPQVKVQTFPRGTSLP